MTEQAHLAQLEDPAEWWERADLSPEEASRRAAGLFLPAQRAGRVEPRAERSDALGKEVS